MNVMTTPFAAPVHFVPSNCPTFSSVQVSLGARHRQHELSQRRHDIRHEARVYRKARRAYHHKVTRDPRVIPAYGYGNGFVHDTSAGFGIQLRF